MNFNATGKWVSHETNMKKKKDCPVTGKRIQFHLIKIICKEEKNYVCKKPNQYLIKLSILQSRGADNLHTRSFKETTEELSETQMLFLNNLKKF